MKELALILCTAWLVTLIYADAIAQTTFQRTYGGASLDKSGSVRQTSDGGYIITGETRSFGAGSSDVYLIKTNHLGDTVWTKTYGGASGDGGSSVQQTSDGGYVIAGGTGSFGAGFGDVYLIKTNSIGDTLWTKTYGGASEEMTAVLFSRLPTVDTSSQVQLSPSVPATSICTSSRRTP